MHGSMANSDVLDGGVKYVLNTGLLGGLVGGAVVLLAVVLVAVVVLVRRRSSKGEKNDDVTAGAVVDNGAYQGKTMYA